MPSEFVIKLAQAFKAIEEAIGELYVLDSDKASSVRNYLVDAEEYVKTAIKEVIEG
jgi:hypothetical protein